MDKKVFIGPDNQATFVCPECGKTKTIDASQYKNIKKTVRLKRKCACGHSYIALLERRKFYRKEVRLPGFYIRESDPDKRPMTVRDLSRSGLKIEVPELGNLQLGDKLSVEFRLDNVHKTQIKKEVEIKTIKDLELGTEFTSRELKNPFDKAYDMAIGFYTFQK